MKFIDKKQKLDYLIELINNQSTGNAELLSQRICVSKRTLYRYLSDLKAIGYKISYCFSRNTYYLFDDTNSSKKI